MNAGKFGTKTQKSNQIQFRLNRLLIIWDTFLFFDNSKFNQIKPKTKHEQTPIRLNEISVKRTVNSMTTPIKSTRNFPRNVPLRSTFHSGEYHTQQIFTN